MTDLSIKYVEVSANDVVDFWVKKYDGTPIEDYDWWYDPAKRVFVLKLYVRPNSSPAEPNQSTPPTDAERGR